MMTVIFVRRVASAAMLWCAVSATVISAQIVNGNDGSLTLSTTPSSDESESGRCELHIWPSKGLRSVYHGWLHGGIVDGAVNGRDGYPEVPSDPLTTARQVELLKDAGVGAMMDRLDVDVIIHSEAPVSTAIRQSQGRLTTSSSPCYSELILEDVFFQEDFVNGSSLKSLIRFRDFGSGEGPPTQFGTWTKTPLKIFPPKEASSNEAALTELSEAFRANLTEFAAARKGGPIKRRVK
ncbi:hypothetical protein [Sphingopyxis terrae]|uniref:hypothetical protein n=1 Tax=Sphingopyxis terrae TaxID=33052 RepID=UPI002A134467|nr:hypothetical protein [Sphingopyxis terrae]MDX8357608.1 hypothetical protein [Sphingopyxis terrae]